MAWDSGGFMGSAGESSQGMDADPVGSGLGADPFGNIFGKNYDSWWRHDAGVRARMGLPARIGNIPTDQGTYLAALQKEINQINQKVQNNNTLDAIWAHNDNLRKNLATDQLFTEHTDPITYHGLQDWSKIGKPGQNFPPTVMGGYPPQAGQSGPYPMGGMPMGSQSGGWPGPSAGGYNTGATPVSDAGWAEGGGEYLRRKPRSLAYDNAYDQWEGGDY